MHQKTITHKFGKEDKYKHFEVPFEVPSNTDIVELKIEMVNNTQEEAIVDIGVKDPEIIRGWTGSDKRHIIITKEYATPGYLPGKIQQGTWNFLLSVYKTPSTGCELVMTVMLHEKHFRWFKGDTHTHTLHSDGNKTIEDMIKACKEFKFDYLISTNHNTTSQNMLLPTDRNMILIPGVELTTYMGHANIFGLKKPFEDYRCRTKEEVMSKFMEAKARGGHIGLNHPFATDCEGCDWTWGFDFPYEWIEIWNTTWMHLNQRTLDWWHGLLCEGKKIPIIGGTDVHKIILYQNLSVPVTYVYADSVDAESIIDGILKGRVFVNSINQGPLLDMKSSGGCVLGETTFDKDVNITVSNLKPGDEVRIVSDKGVEQKHVATGSNELNLGFSRKSSQKFVRIEASRQNRDSLDIVLLSNPIYFN